MNDHFWNGFEKQANQGAGAVGYIAGKIQNAPKALWEMGKKIPETASKAIGAVKDYSARSQRAMRLGRDRALGPAGRASKKGVPVDVSKNVAQARVNTGETSPNAIKRDKGSMLGNTRNALLAIGAGTAAGVHYGMKEPQNEQVQQPQ